MFPHGILTRFFRMVLFACLVGLTLVHLTALDKKDYKVYIVLDTQLDKFLEVQEGFKASLDKQLAAAGSKAVYSYFDTKLDSTQAAAIVQAIRAGKPDLVCTVNWPSSFADINVARKLNDPSIRVVSINSIPVQSGAAQSWQKPGGSITGVGVFVQFDSMIKVAKRLKPQLKEVLFFTWDAMADLNAYFEPEIKAACQRENVRLVEFKKVANAEEQFDWLARMDKEHPDAIVIGGISAWVHKDGKPADMMREEREFIHKTIRRLPLVTYDEVCITYGYPIGTCVIWSDMGAQLAEKGFKVLAGAKPGDLPWDYPRSYSLMFNQAAAKLIGLKIPEALLTSAYRVYTDFDGHYIGQKN